MKPNCKRCEYLEVNTHSDESYCTHPVADGEQIFVDYPQQRRPKWCPMMAGARKMTVELTYADGRKFVANVPETASENVMSCLLDDVSVAVTTGKEETE